MAARYSKQAISGQIRRIEGRLRRCHRGLILTSGGPKQKWGILCTRASVGLSSLRHAGLHYASLRMRVCYICEHPTCKLRYASDASCERASCKRAFYERELCKHAVSCERASWRCERASYEQASKERASVHQVIVYQVSVHQRPASCECTS
eukprot:6211785-Pleurochrysis_carterae.AAC.2